jgi:hypothetical protein
MRLNGENFINTWLTQAEHILFDTPLENTVVIVYNEWVSNPEYREQKAKELGLKVCPPINKMGRFSSFTNKDDIYGGNGNKFNNRWKFTIVYKEFLKVITNPKINELSKKIFGKDFVINVLNTTLSTIVEQLLKYEVKDENTGNNPNR